MKAFEYNVDEVLDELYSYSMFGIKLGLENIKRICEILGNPEREYKVIHLAGTNGKGSTATTIERCIIKAGFNVGKFTSPHILKFNERIQHNGIQISDEDICRYFIRVRDAIKETDIRATFFEMTTAMMFLYFKEMNIDYLVLETGMGGRYDATNVVDSKIAIITNITLDHVGFLGDSIYKIAKEKAGIIKSSSTVIVGDTKEDVRRAVLEEVEEYICPLTKYDYTYELDTRNYTTNIKLEDREYVFSLFGHYQVENFMCAYEALKVLGISDDIIEEAVREVRWMGRFQVVKRDPLLVLDGAHNEDAARCLKENIRLSYSKEQVVALVSVLEDKDIEGVLGEIEEFTDTIVLTSLKDFKRGLDSKELSKYTKGFKNVYLEDDIVKAYEVANKLSKEAIIVCGSFYLLNKFIEGNL